MTKNNQFLFGLCAIFCQGFSTVLSTDCEALWHQRPFPINFYWIATQRNVRRGLSTRRFFHFIHKLFTVHSSTLHKIAASSSSSSSLSILARQPSLCKGRSTKDSVHKAKYVRHSALNVNAFLPFDEESKAKGTNAFWTEMREMKVLSTHTGLSGLADSMIRLCGALTANESSSNNKIIFIISFHFFHSYFTRGFVVVAGAGRFCWALSAVWDYQCFPPQCLCV